MPRLVDGTEVDSSSEAWRHECEARAIAALPTLAQRRAWLEDLQRKYGADRASRLRQTMAQIWATRKGVE